MRIVAYRTSSRNGKVLLEESGGQFIISNNPEDLLSFLAEPYEDTIKVCWNLDATVSLILPLLSKGVCRKLQSVARAWYTPFSLFYVPSKVFSATHAPTKNNASLYELQQYFPELGTIDDPEELVSLGQKLLYELDKMGLRPSKLTSPVKIYDDCLMSKMDLPELKDMPKEAAEFAYHCSGKLWIEAHQLGFWPDAYSYDMVSAFPMATKGLIDTRDCEWITDPEFREDAIYGYARANVTINDDVLVSPIIMEIPEGLISPVGTWPTYLTKGEMVFIDKHKIGNYSIHDGWWAIPKVKPSHFRKPLYSPMTKLLSYKQMTDLQALLAKRMSTGVYGKFGEERAEEFGEYFFPCWFAEISTQARLKVAEFLYAYGIGPTENDSYKTLIHIGVDGFTLSTPLVKYRANERWRTRAETILVVSSGLVYTKTTKPKGLILQDILEMIAANPRKRYYSKAVKRRLTLGDSLARDHLENIGKEISFNSSINLVGQEHDREFIKLPKTGEALLNNKYTSLPRRA